MSATEGASDGHAHAIDVPKVIPVGADGEGGPYAQEDAVTVIETRETFTDE